MTQSPYRWLSGWLSAMALVAVAGCASNKGDPAPVEERHSTGRPAPRPAVAEPVRPATEPGSYVVKQGDTLIRIGLETGQSWRDLARWNGIENPNLIEVGQVLRVVPPLVVAEAPVVTRPVASSKVESRPLESRPTEAKPPVVVPVPASSPSASAAPAKAVADDDVQWAWPAGGAVIAAFDDPRNKGVTLAGKAGDPVVAAADGVVMYAGTGIRGLGKLIIVKHSGQLLSAYAHNQNLLVKEDQAVRRGQKIAEMGSTDAERVQLHFEVRRQGKPIDPQKVLPQR